MRRKTFLFAVILVIILIQSGFVHPLGVPDSQVYAQVRISDTPVPVVLPQVTLSPTPAVLISPTPTFTPTPEPPSVVLEAAIALSDIQVRDYPETGTYLGTLEIGRQYPVTGQYYSWVQFIYPAAENELAWVYAPTVRLLGDLSTVPQVDPNAVASNAGENPETATALALLQIPGAAETATAEARIVIVPTLDIINSNPGGFPATFTPPADIVLRIATTDPNAATPSEPSSTTVLSQSFTDLSREQIPPIIPIVVLAGVGLVMFLISLLRR